MDAEKQRVLEGRGVGGRVSLVVGIKKGTYCMEHWVWYINNESWKTEKIKLNLKIKLLGHLGGSVVKSLPSAQVMISGSWDRTPHRALCSTGSLLPFLSLSACFSACLGSLAVK